MHKVVLLTIFHIADAPNSSMLPIVSIMHAGGAWIAP